jgi:hypothetical protein
MPQLTRSPQWEGAFITLCDLRVYGLRTHVSLLVLHILDHSRELLICLLEALSLGRYWIPISRREAAAQEKPFLHLLLAARRSTVLV